MKKLLLNLLTFGVVIAIIVVLLLTFGTEEGARYVYKGNTEHKIIPLKPNTYQCSECSMPIEAMAYSVELITEEGDTYFFDEIGCAVLWLKTHQPKIARFVTQTLDTHHWIAVKKAYYSRTAPSPMGYGFGALEHPRARDIPYEEMRLLMLQGKHLHDPFIKKQLLSE